MSWARRVLRARRDEADQGTTLMELMMGMTVMSVFLAIATTAIVSMFSSTSKIQGVQNSATQLNTAFVRLDKQVRYASIIDQPVISAGTVSVAFQTTGILSTFCTQLRIRPVTASTQQLVERTWTVTTAGDGTTSASNLSAWTQLAMGITLTDSTGTAVVPFTVSTPTGGTVQQLQLRLIDLDTGTSATRSATETTFSAVNSAAASAAANAGNAVAGCAQAGTV